jgi:hypothetical protein
VEGGPANEHVFFVDDMQQARQFDPVKQLNTHECLINRKSNRLTLDQLKSAQLPDWIDDEFVKEMIKKRGKKYKEMTQRSRRFESLKKLEQSYDLKPVRICCLSLYRRI